MRRGTISKDPPEARLESSLEFRGRRVRFEAEIRYSKRRCTCGSPGVYLNWNECRRVSYLLPNHQSNAHLRQINSKMKWSKFLRPPESHRRNRSKTRSEISISLVEGRGEVDQTVLGGLPNTLLILSRCYQLSIAFQRFLSLLGCTQCPRISGTTHARLQHITGVLWTNHSPYRDCLEQVRFDKE